VGGIHGGWEANTVVLVQQLIAYFTQTPGDVLPGMSLILIPSLNPDGLSVGRSISGRFNNNGVDLNRNWACDWSADAVWREGAVDPGPTAFSEPETTLLAQYIRAQQPAAVLFYHSAANGIFAGECLNTSHSLALAQVYGEATGYPYGQPFTAYRVTGTAANWVDGQGIPAVDVELASWERTEFERNLRGVLALQCWLLGAAVDALPVCRQ
jgi:predicted deacylase